MIREIKDKEIIFVMMYVIFTTVCFAAGCCMAEQRKVFFDLWFFVTAAIWLAVWAAAVCLFLQKAFSREGK